MTVNSQRKLVSMDQHIISHNHTPKITVVTVVFNDVKNLEKTMLSVLNQTYTNIEYIVIDGGSNDGTIEIIKKYTDRLGFWVSEKDKGMFDAMNKGASHATGEWIQILNSGDYLMSNTIIEELFSKEHSNVDIVYGGFIGNFSGQAVECPPALDVSLKDYQGMKVCHSAFFARREIVTKFPYNLLYHHSAYGKFVSRFVFEKYRFEKVDKIIFRVGTLGNSNTNWLSCRMENWKIARHYFPGIRTEWFHGYRLVREVMFRIFKYVTSLIGLYQLARYIYHRKLKHKILLLPKNIKPFIE